MYDKDTPQQSIEFRRMNNTTPSLGHVYASADAVPPTAGENGEIQAGQSESITGLQVRKHLKAGLEVAGKGLKALWGGVEVKVERDNGRLRIDFIEREKSSPVELLPLLESLPEVPPLTAVLGWSGDMQPVLLDLQTAPGAHILAVGQSGAGKTTLLRAIALSLAIHNKESRLQMVVLEPNPGQQKRNLQALADLPHLLTPITEDPAIIIETLEFLAEEIRHRQREQVSTPAIAILADDLESLMQVHPALVNQTLTYIVRQGAKHGVHLIASTADVTHPQLHDLIDADIPSRLVGKVNTAEEAEIATDALDSYAEHLLGAGDFLAAVGDVIVRFQAADIVEKDLLFCADHLQQRRPPSLMAQQLQAQAKHIQQPSEHQENAWYAPSQQEPAVIEPLTQYVVAPQEITPPVEDAKPIESAPSTEWVDWKLDATAVAPEVTQEKPEKISPLGDDQIVEPDTGTAPAPTEKAKSANSMKHLASIFASLYPHSQTADLSEFKAPKPSPKQPPKTTYSPPPPVTAVAEDEVVYFTEDKPAPSPQISSPPSYAEPPPTQTYQPPPPPPPPVHDFWEESEPAERETPSPQTKNNGFPAINEPMPKNNGFPAIDERRTPPIHIPRPEAPPLSKSQDEDPWMSGLLEVEKTPMPRPQTQSRPPSRVPINNTPTQPPHTNPRDLIRVAKKLGTSKPAPKPSAVQEQKIDPALVDPQAMIESQALPDIDAEEAQALPDTNVEEAQATAFVQTPRRVRRLQRRVTYTKQTESDGPLPKGDDEA